MRLKTNKKLRKIGNKNIIVRGDAGFDDYTEVLTFNATAALLWESLMGKDFTIKSISDLLRSQFDVSLDNSEQVELDAQQFVEQLDKHGLLEK